VTITEENEEALGNKLFRQALKKVGLKPPANEQVGTAIENPWLSTKVQILVHSDLWYLKLT